MPRATKSSIRKSKHFSLIAKANVSAQVTVTGLYPGRLYELACMAESDSGGESELKNLKETSACLQKLFFPTPLV